MEDETKKVRIQVKGGQLHLNGKAQKKYVHPPTWSEMFSIDKDKQDKIDKLELHQGATIKDKSSTFTGFALHVTSTTDVKLAYKKVKQLIPESDHIMAAYVVKQYNRYHDNGEHSAGRKIAAILADRNSTNTVVFVSCVFGGIPLGSKRFLHIEKAAKNALNIL